MWPRAIVWTSAVVLVSALAGALIGAGVFGTLYARFQGLFALPALKVEPSKRT